MRHQQFRFLSVAFDTSSSVAVAPFAPPSVLLHIPIPFIGVLTPFVVHVDVQSVMLSPGDLYEHVVLLFNATHLVTAWAPVVIAQSTAPVIKIFDFIVLLLFVF